MILKLTLNRSNSLAKQKGFTLIELMVATFISAFISILAYQSIDSITTVKQSVEVTQNRLSELQRAVWKIQQDLLQVVARPITNEFGNSVAAIQLKVDGDVEFTRISQENSRYETGGLLRVGYKFRDNKLYRLVWNVLDRSPDSQPHAILLLEGVRSFQLVFYDNKKIQYPLWPPQLYDTDKLQQKYLTMLPSLIKLSLEFESVDGVQKLERYFSTVEGMPLPQDEDDNV